MRSAAPRTPQQLWAWVKVMLGFDIPRRGLVAGHDAPFDYLCHAFFEDARPPAQRNALVWAARGAGKTQIAAIATLLDMLFKPGIEICILGGSFAQSSRMHNHLRKMLENEALIGMVDGRLTLTHVQLRNGSRVEVIGQAQTAVRGRRVHRLRCDEVELFEPEVWEAAQMITRSGRCGDIEVRAGVEALSTMHKPFGLMSRLARDADASSTRLFRWNVIDVLELCPPTRVCDHCNLFANGCGGLAKRHASVTQMHNHNVSTETLCIASRPLIRLPAGGGGFFHIDDALNQQASISPQAWRSEMLCERPDVSDCVYPDFEEALHVFDDDPQAATLRAAHASCAGSDEARPGSLIANNTAVTWLGGLDFGYRAPSVLLLAMLDGCNVLHVMDEIVERGCTTPRMIDLARQRFAALCSSPSPSPDKGRERAGVRVGARVGQTADSPAGARTNTRNPSCVRESAARIAWIGADPAGLQRSDQTGLSAIALWRRAGFAIRTHATTIDAGLEAVRSRLRTADSSIGLRIHRRCSNLIRALREYHFDPQRPQSANPVKDGPDHAADALRYLIVNLDGAGASEAHVRPY